MLNWLARGLLAIGALFLGLIVFIMIRDLLAPTLDADFETRLAAAAPAESVDLIAAEAAKLDVTALSVTVIAGDLPARTHHFGRARKGGLMQAASLSKPVAAAVILKLADERGVALDDDIRAQITSLDIAGLEGGDRPVSLRQLLSHTTGASQSGYPGYPRGGAIPSTAEIIAAPPRFFEFPVEFDGTPGEFRYSGGGYSIAQLWAEDVTGQDFASLAKATLLDPLGMKQSTFTQPIDPAAIAPLTIVGADSGFDPLGGVFTALDDSWHDYPEQAAAGLWTTSADYALFVAALLDAAGGAENAIPQAVARAMIAPQAETGWENGASYGLGVMLATDPDGQGFTVSHTGANAGYRSIFIATPADSDAQRRIVTVMGNTASAAALNRAIAQGLIRQADTLGAAAN